MKINRSVTLTHLERLEWVHWVLDEISQGTIMHQDDIEKARDFIEYVREYIEVRDELDAST